MPPGQYRSSHRAAGDHLTATDLNFYIANDLIAVPLFDERTDEATLEVLVDAFPGRNVIGIPSREILLGAGNIDCITQ
jgi:agmatine deiminase